MLQKNLGTERVQRAERLITKQCYGRINLLFLRSIFLPSAMNSTAANLLDCLALMSP